MFLRIWITIIACFTLQLLKAQEIKQNIKGQVIDASSLEPLPFVNILVLNTTDVIGTATDENGNFVLENLSPGRYSLQATFLGFETIIVNDILLSSSKEAQITIRLTENIATLNEVIVKAKVQKEKSINKQALVSAKMLSVEEANRYAGGFDDPARLASSFAGVASNIGNNAISIRGNAPKFTQWKMEGIEIPNPNHFANLGTFGGGGLTALSSNLLANSDFFTGALPSEYNNALSGVFDMQMRNGNNSNHEHTAEIGLIGIDFASEGPLSKNNNSSYLVNYRYSTLSLISSLLPDEAEGIKYQDLAYKIKLPTKRMGTFSFWGIGLIDTSGQESEKDSQLWNYEEDKEKEVAKQYMGATGINNSFFLKNGGSLSTTLALSTSGLNFTKQQLDTNFDLQPKSKIENTNYNITFKSIFNKKVHAKYSYKAGMNAVIMNYNLFLAETINNSYENLISEKGTSTLLSGFYNTTLSHHKFTFNLGLNTQLFTLNNNKTFEPRLGIAYQVKENHEISFGYGLHSRLENLNIYFSKPLNTNEQTNKNLDFTKAHHIVLGYNWNCSKNLHLRIEPYYQHLFDVPIIQNTNESLINNTDNWFVTDTFNNKGIARNYGIDLMLEKYITNGFYYLISASIFNSEFKTTNNEWFNTKFNRNFLINCLAGKEFKTGKENQNLFSLNFRLSYQGGDRYSPIDVAASVNQQDVIYNESNPFSLQNQASFVSHFTANYQWNKAKTSQKLSLKIINANGYKENFRHRFNFTNQSVEMYREAIIIPNLSYKIMF